MADIGAVTPGVYNDGTAFGMLAELTQQPRPRPSLRRRFGEQDDGPVHADGQHVIIGSERLEGRPMLDVRTEAADSRNDRLACLGMPPELARQGEQSQSSVEIDIGGFHRSRQGNPLRLERAIVRAELDIVPVRAFLESDRQATRRIVSEQRVCGRTPLAVSFERERPRVSAIRIIGAADESAEFAELDAEPARATERANARIAPGAVIREKMAP